MSSVSPFAQLAALLGKVNLNSWRSAPRGVPRQTLDDALAIFVERTAAKEGEAAAPAKNAEADGRQHEIAVGERLTQRVKAAARSKSSADYESTDGGGDVNDNATREVLRAHRVQPAVHTPKPVRYRIVAAPE